MKNPDFPHLFKTFLMRRGIYSLFESCMVRFNAKPLSMRDYLNRMEFPEDYINGAFNWGKTNVNNLTDGKASNYWAEIDDEWRKEVRKIKEGKELL